MRFYIYVSLVLGALITVAISLAIINVFSAAVGGIIVTALVTVTGWLINARQGRIHLNYALRGAPEEG